MTVEQDYSLSDDEDLPFYFPTPSNLWSPTIPLLESIFPYKGPLANLYRLIRLVWVVSFIPLHVAVILFSNFVYRLPNRLVPRLEGWDLKKQIMMPVIKSIVWTLAAWGVAPAIPHDVARGIPVISRYLFMGRYMDGKILRAKEVEIPVPSNSSEWITRDAVDITGNVKPGPCPAFWVWREIWEGETGWWGYFKELVGLRANKKLVEVDQPDVGEKVLIYLVGGGYVWGHPLQSSRVFDLVRHTGIPTLGVNYRKAVTPSQSYPASLQDVISAYAFLTKKGFKKILLAGDSAGGGLAITLLQYLSDLKLAQPSSNGPRFEMPTHLLLYSPWVDMTLSSKSHEENITYDLLSRSQMYSASWCYTQNTWNHDLEVEDPKSIFSVGRAHPYFSPSLPSSIHSLRKIVIASRHRSNALPHTPKVLNIYGSAELLTEENNWLCDNFRKAGLKVQQFSAKDCPHVWIVVGKWLFPEECKVGWKMLEEFVQDDK